MNFAITLISLGIVIVIHELGHMIAARRAGIGVYEFAVGFGPKIFGRKIGETVYTLRAFPFGGFVKLAGLDDEKGNEAPKSESFPHKTLSQRFWTIAWGPIANILLGFILFVSMFTLVGVPEPVPTIQKIMPDSVAEAVGLQQNDQITAINNIPIKSVVDDAIPLIQQAPNQTLSLTLLRNNTPITLDITPRPTENNPNKGLIGVEFKIETVRYNPIKAIGLGIEKTFFTATQVFSSLGMLFNKEVGLKDMAGPIGIVQLASHQLSQSILQFLNIMALISISLGVINLFPIPVLDGGHLMFLTYEFIFKRTPNNKVQNALTYTGAAILLSLMAFIIFNDIASWQDRINLLNQVPK